MASRKQVNGRSYPFIYNVTMAVGSRKSVENVFSFELVNRTTVIKTGNVQVPITMPGVAISSRREVVASSEPNKRDDVMLVQYFLKRIYQQGQNCNPPLNQGGGAAHLKIDGWYGAKTQGAIEHFQLEMRRNGRNIATDGIVDPERGDSTTASISRTDYTISWLNKYFWLLYPALAPNIVVDPECPPELKLAIGGL